MPSRPGTAVAVTHPAGRCMFFSSPRARGPRTLYGRKALVERAAPRTGDSSRAGISPSLPLPFRDLPRPLPPTPLRCRRAGPAPGAPA